MGLTKEYRIPLPVSVEEYRIAQLYMVAKISKQQTGHGEGVQILENRPYDDEYGKGQYTHKIFRVGSRLPGWLKAIVPASALQIEEKAWNAYPYCKTVYSCPFLGDRFSITIETRYLPDGGVSENALGLSEKELKDRVIDIVDIAYDPLDASKYKPEEDPALYVSQKTGRGKLEKNWMHHVQPVMCSYKNCAVEFRYWGFQSRVESFVHQKALRDVFLLGHRQAFCWMDEWYGLTLEDVRKIEEETQRELDKLIAEDDAHAEVGDKKDADEEKDGADQV